MASSPPKANLVVSTPPYISVKLRTTPPAQTTSKGLSNRTPLFVEMARLGLHTVAIHLNTLDLMIVLKYIDRKHEKCDVINCLLTAIVSTAAA